MSPIKPPDGRVPGAASPTSGPAPSTAPAQQRGGVSFDDALAAAERARAGAPQTTGPGAVQQTGATGASEATVKAGAADPVAELAQAVRSGAISAQQAVERLVDRVADGMGRNLSVAQRAELGVVLRAALQNDPALAALRDALE